MRALTQGLDERASWNRYLRLEGDNDDLRTVRRTIAWIRDEFAAAARREQKPGTARLLLLDPVRFSATSGLPSLTEFAESKGMADFSEEEQLEAYVQAFPDAGRWPGQSRAGLTSRRARVIERQLEALRWLQDLVAQDPRPDDAVSAWLNPSVASRLERASIPTLQSLVQRMNAVGARWWAPVPGVGALKAQRIQDWLASNQKVLGLRIGAHVGLPRRQLPPVMLDEVVSAGTAIRPYEKFVVPAAYDGSHGLFRAPLHECLLRASNDYEAVGAWLASKRRDEQAGPLSATQRAYRKEAERLHLWSVLEQKKALSSLSVADIAGFRLFLSEPPTTWCGPRHNQRWSPMWRPLEGPLAPAAVRHACLILGGLFSFLVTQRYTIANPFVEN